MFLFGITTIIFMLTTTDLILDFELTSQDISSTIHAFDRSFDNVWSPQKIRAVNVVNTVIPRLNPILSDVVFVWRAIVLWKYDRRVVAILSICLFSTVVASIYDLKLLFEAPLSFQAVNYISKHPGEVAAIFVGPILITNLLSTSFIAWKAWDYHRTVGPHIRKGRTPGHVEKVLMLLIETDIVYCIFWMIHLLTAFGIFSSISTYDIIKTVTFYISSTYPMSVNVLAVTTQSHKFREVWIQSAVQ